MPFTQECIVLSLVEIDQVVLEKMIFKFCNFVIISPFGKLGALHLNPRHPKMSLVDTGLVVLEKKIFKFRQYIFAIS